MICQHTLPEDRVMRCTRQATERFEQQVTTIVPVSGSRRMSVYSYTCAGHAEHGPTIAREQAPIWVGRDNVLSLDAVEHTSLPAREEGDI